MKNKDDIRFINGLEEDITRGVKMAYNDNADLFEKYKSKKEQARIVFDIIFEDFETDTFCAWVVVQKTVQTFALKLGMSEDELTNILMDDLTEFVRNHRE